MTPEAAHADFSGIAQQIVVVHAIDCLACPNTGDLLASRMLNGTYHRIAPMIAFTPNGIAKAWHCRHG